MTSNRLSHRRRNARLPPICKKPPGKPPPIRPPTSVGFSYEFWAAPPIGPPVHISEAAVFACGVDPLNPLHFFRDGTYDYQPKRYDAWIDSTTGELTQSLHLWAGSTDYGTAHFGPEPWSGPLTTQHCVATSTDPPATGANDNLYWGPHVP